MDPIPPSNPPATPDLTFQVMPQDLNHPEKAVSSAPMPPPPPGSAPLPPKPPVRDIMPGMAASPPGNHRNLFIIVSAIVVIGLIGFGLYYFLGAKKNVGTEQSQVTTRLPKVWLQQYFAQNLNNGSCSDTTICGDEADPDNDGLNNYDEFKTGTSPIDADTDKDGLADGDEIHVYKTEATLKYTDRRDIVAQNNWTDSYQTRNGYDPLTPGKKFTDSRLQQIAADKITYPLHEPTVTSLGGSTAPTNPNPPQSNAKSVTVTIESNKFNPTPITINVGDSVVWLSKDTVAHHVASDPHPTHTGLPGLESPNLTTNQTFSFTFTKAGTFGYHDHLNPEVKGSVIVK